VKQFQEGTHHQFPASVITQCGNGPSAGAIGRIRAKKAEGATSFQVKTRDDNAAVIALMKWQHF
jgi:hypothetical protein